MSMWRSTARQTGANTDALGAPRRWGGRDVPQDAEGPTYHSQPWNRPVPQVQVPASIQAAIEANEAAAPPSTEGGEKKRKSRWGSETQKVLMPGLPTAIKGNVEGAALETYAISLRLEEINRKLRMGDYVPNERERSASPPPQYNSSGIRTNTREVRYRKKLEDERVRLIDKAIKADPTFRPPVEYMQQKRSGRPQDKVYIPVKEFPEINFFGLLVGPRGNSLKKMERDSGAKISIRGKGSVKEGKGRPDGFGGGDEDEDLHCLVTADTDEKVNKCVHLINTVIETAASTPEAQNDHKRNQLRELAQLNGTLRDDEGQICQNCGQLGHRRYDCPEQKNFTANIICRSCGQAGHMARDCIQRRGAMGMHPGMMPPGGPGGPAPTQRFDSEFDSLMAELGEKPAGASSSGPGGPGGPMGANVPPWRIPSNWNPPQPLGGPMGGPGFFPRGPVGPGPGYGPPGGGYGQPGGGWPQSGGYPVQQAPLPPSSAPPPPGM